MAESAVRPRIESQTQAYIFDSPKSGSRHRLPSSVPAQYLRWHAEGPEERATHAFSVRKARFLRHDINRVSSLFDHEPGGLQPKPLAICSLTGKTLISERIVGNLNTEAGKIVTKRPVAKRLILTSGE